MYTEDSNTGFLGNFKSLFSSKKNADTEVASAAHENTSTLVEEYIPIKNTPTETAAEGPMGTRTVDYSHVAYTPVTKAIEENPVMEEQLLHDNHDLDIQFASALIEKGGKFIYCESVSEVVAELKVMAEGTYFLLGK
jgi:hypothetical protein